MKIILGVPAYRRQVVEGHIPAALSLGAACYANKVRLENFLTVDSCFVEHSRNVLLHRAVAADTDWLLMLDADTYVPEGRQLLRMLLTAEHMGYQVVAAPVERRKHENVFNVPGVNPESWADKLVEVERVGAACMGISIKWIKSCWPVQPWFTPIALTGPEPVMRGEDFSFCDGVRDRGGKVLLDGRVQTRHDS